MHVKVITKIYYKIQTRQTAYNLYNYIGIIRENKISQYIRHSFLF